MSDEGDAPAAPARPSFDLVALILSSRQRELTPARRRQAVRASWASHTAHLGAADAATTELCSVKPLFVVGGGKARAHVRSDAAGNEDLLVLPVPDGYRQITQKVVAAFAWVTSTLQFKYVLKTDDDSFICLARLLELLRPMARGAVYLGVANRHHSVVLQPSNPQYMRWRDAEYVALFNRTVYPPYMQGAGYVLSRDMAQLVVRTGSEAAGRVAIEDALVGTLLDGHAKPRSSPKAFRHKNKDDYAVSVCERDTEFVLLHKLTVEELKQCRAATLRRRSARCPHGPCTCQSLGHKFKLKRLIRPPGKEKQGPSY